MLVQHLDLVFAEALQARDDGLLELRIERGPLDDATALEALDAWWASRADADA
jgi:hypothetical protein